MTPQCNFCRNGRFLCPGGPHPFGPCGEPRTCPKCNRKGA